VSNSAQTPDEQSGQGVSKCTKTQGLTAGKTKGNTDPKPPPVRTAGDSSSTADVGNSNKHNNKPDNKLSKEQQEELSEISEAWTSLPDDIRSAILTLIRTASGIWE